MSKPISQCGTAPTAARLSTTCSPPSPKTSRRMVFEALEGQFDADEEEQEHDAQIATRPRLSGIGRIRASTAPGT